MKSAFMGRAVVLLLGILLSASAESADNEPKKHASPLPGGLQERVLALERLVRQQAGLLEQLQAQLAELQTNQRSVRSSSASAESVPAASDGPQRKQLPGETSALAASAVQTQAGQAKATEPQREGKPRASLLAGWTGSHPYIRSADGDFTMQFGGRVQFDWRSYTGTATPPSSFVLRRARLEAEGQLFKHYEYKVQADFTDDDALLRDGYLNINYKKAFQVRFGQFKAPFSQEAVQSSNYIDFVERSSVNNLTPRRSPGLMVHGDLGGGIFKYRAGTFNGLGELRTNTSSTPESYLQLRFTPFRSRGPALLKNFGFGGAFAEGRHTDGISFRGRTASRSVTFFRPVPVNGKIVRSNAEFSWRFRNVSLRGEYDQTHQHRQNLGAGGTNLPGVIGKGYLVQATYLLTGEKKTARGITPNSALLGSPRGRGAWELAFRYENLQMVDAVNGNRAEAFTFGVNWWLTKFVRYQSNFILERFTDPARSPSPDDRDSFSYLSRVQVIF